MPTVRRGCPALLVCVAVGVLCASPRGAFAQQDVFADALVELGSAAAGRNGDEGPRIRASLDRMAVGLATWDRALAAIEADMAVRLETAAPSEEVRGRLTLARLLVARGRRTDALAELEAAATLDAERVDLHLLRGLVREATGAVEHAVEDFRLAWSIDPRDPVVAYLVADRGLSLDETIDIQPQIDALVAAQEARLGSQSDRVFDGLTLLEDGLASVPVFVPAAYAAGFALVAEGRLQDAIASFRASAATDPLVVDTAAASPGLRQGVTSLRQGATEAALRTLDAVVAAAPDSSEARRFQGLAYRAAGRPDDAIAALERAVDLAPADDRARVTLARVLGEQGRWQDAEAVLLETTALLPQAGEAHWALSFLYDERNRIEEAVQALDAAAALALPEGRGGVYFRQAWLNDLRHEYEAAAVALEPRARLNPRSPTAYKDLGLARWRSGHHRRSLATLLLASVLDPNDPESLSAIGQIHLDAGRFRKAEVALRRALLLDPDRGQARFALGRTLVRLGQAEEGRTHLDMFSDLRRTDLANQRETFTLDTLIEEAEGHVRQREYGEAAKLWQQVIELKPDHASYRVSLADVLAASGDPVAAIPHLEAAATMDASPDVHHRLAVLYRRVGRPEDAAAAEAALGRLVPGTETGR